VPVVWQWQRDRDHRNRRGRNSGPAVAPTAPASNPENPPPSAPGPVDPRNDPEFLAGLRPIPTGSGDPPAPWPASDIHGVSPSGDPIEVRLADREGRLLLAFLNTDCDGCEEFWKGLQDPDATGIPAGTEVVAITKGPGSIPSDDVRKSAAGIRVLVVMSDQLWIDYRVLGYPFFVLVDRASNLVVGETVGLGWDDVLSMARAAL
jgi:hypothetical protein